MCQIERVREEIPAELPLFTLETPLQDIITKRSSFNPYPEKADQGLEVWSMQGVEWNPIVVIRYPQTGDVYRTIIPFTHPETVVNPIFIPKELHPEPAIVLPWGIQDGQWKSIEAAWAGIAQDLLERDTRGIEISALLERALTERDEKGEIQIKFGKAAAIGIYEVALQEIDANNWRQVIKLMRYGFNQIEYHVAGRTVNARDMGLVGYDEEVVLDLFPQLRRFDKRISSWDEKIDPVTSSLFLSTFLHRMFTARVNSLALDKAVAEEKSEVVRENYRLIQLLQQKLLQEGFTKLQEVQERLGIASPVISQLPDFLPFSALPLE